MKHIKKHLSYYILALITLLAIFLRFNQLSTNPVSLNWDDASVGYNAYSILKTGKDEYGNFLPLEFREFDNYQLPIYVYSDVPAIALFGLTPFAVRLPAAIIGSLGVFFTFFLVREMFREKENAPKRNIASIIALLATFFMSISPWDIQLSRSTFEPVFGVLFFILGVWLLFKSFHKSWWLLFSILFFSLSLYTYYSFRLVTPLFLVGLCIFFWRQLLRRKIFTAMAIGIFLLFALPIAFELLFTNQATARLGMVSIFSSGDTLTSSIHWLEYAKAHHDIVGEIVNNRRVVYAGLAVKAYLDHFTPDFLFLRGDAGGLHHAINMGMLYLWELPFVLVGIFYVAKQWTRKSGVLFLWVFLAPVAAAFTTGTPDPIRASVMIPPLHIFTAAGIYFVALYVGKVRTSVIRRGVYATLIITLLCNLVYYFHQYYIQTPIQYAPYWQYGTEDALIYAKQHENQYDHIVMTYRYDQPYIFYLFYNKVDPLTYQHIWLTQTSKTYSRMYRQIGKYTFENINWGTQNAMKNTLFIGTSQEIPPNVKVDDTIYFPDATPAFVITHT